MLAIIDAPIILGILIIWCLFVFCPCGSHGWRLGAGRAGPLALLLLVPLGILIVFGVLAFAEWPNYRGASRIWRKRCSLCGSALIRRLTALSSQLGDRCGTMGVTKCATTAR